MPSEKACLSNLSCRAVHKRITLYRSISLLRTRFRILLRRISAVCHLYSSYPSYWSYPSHSSHRNIRNPHSPSFFWSRQITASHAGSRPVTQFSEKKDCLFFYASPCKTSSRAIESALFVSSVLSSAFRRSVAKTLKTRESNQNLAATHQKSQVEIHLLNQ